MPEVQVSDSFDINITICIKSNGDIPAGVIIDVLEMLDRSIYRQEEQEISDLEKEFDEWPSPVFDAMKYRLSHLRNGRALNIAKAENGSLILIGAAAGLALWPADKTLGETVKDAWKDSNSHERLKNFLKSRLLFKRDNIAHDIRSRRFSHRDDFEIIDVEVSEKSPSLKITVLPSSEKPVIPRPSQQDFLSRDDDV